MEMGVDESGNSIDGCVCLDGVSRVWVVVVLMN